MRITKDDYFLKIAGVVSERGTCHRRKVGAVLTNRRGHILSTGYNGPYSGALHCIDTLHCSGLSSPSGTNLEGCEAIHAEANALLQCRDVYEIDTLYCTHSPCIQCMKLLLNTSTKRVVFVEDYPNYFKDIWLKAGREWIQKPLKN